MPDPLRLTEVDPSTLSFRHAWGVPLLAAAHDEGTSVLFRGEEGDLIAVADLADGSGMGLDGEVVGAGKGGVWLVGGTLPERAAVVHVRDGDTWIRALVSAGERVWLGVIRAEQEIVRFEDAAGEVVARSLPAAGVERAPIADAWTPCPACGACAWELLRWTEPGFEHDDDPVWGAPWPESAARCTVCGHCVDGVDDEEEQDEEEAGIPAPQTAGLEAVREMLARGHQLYELSDWPGHRRFAAAARYFAEDELTNHVLLEFENGARQVSVVTLHHPDPDAGVFVLAAAIDGADAFTPDRQRSGTANALAETLFYEEQVAQQVDQRERRIPLVVDGQALPLSVIGGPTQWSGVAEVAPGVSVTLTGAGIAPEACALRRVTDLDAYLPHLGDEGH